MPSTRIGWYVNRTAKGWEYEANYNGWLLRVWSETKLRAGDGDPIVIWKWSAMAFADETSDEFRHVGGQAESKEEAMLDVKWAVEKAK